MKCIFLQTVGIFPRGPLSVALEDRRRACERPLTFVFPGSENGLWATAMTNARAITMTYFVTGEEASKDDVSGYSLPEFKLSPSTRSYISAHWRRRKLPLTTISPTPLFRFGPSHLAVRGSLSVSLR